MAFIAPPDSPNDRLQLGFIGVGRAGAVGPASRRPWRSPAWRWWACATPTRARVERPSPAPGGRAKDYGDWKALLADKSIDAVVVATPTTGIAPHVVEALRAGKHVYVEKPMTLTIDDGLRDDRAPRRVGPQSCRSAARG